MTKEELIRWLEENGRSNQWLAGKCGVKPKTVSTWRSDRPIPAKAQVIIQGLMAADEAKRESLESIPQNLVLEFSKSDFEKIERAALSSKKGIRQWALDALNHAPTLESLIRELQKAPSSKVARESLNRVLKKMVE